MNRITDIICKDKSVDELKNEKSEYKIPNVNKKIIRDYPDINSKKSQKRKIGVVFMYFFKCPSITNGHLNWCDTHVLGMNKKDEYFKGYYNPKNYYFWYNEIRDMIYSGLDFFLLNVYGNDLHNEIINNLKKSMDTLSIEYNNDPIKIGIFDDTWLYNSGHYFKDVSPTFEDSTKIEYTANILFNKWKKIFDNDFIWKYLIHIDGKPIIYFYNAGKLGKTYCSDILNIMKNKFFENYKVYPFIVLDIGYGKNLKIADRYFKWNTFNHNKIYFQDKNFCNAMVKWDPYKRDAKKYGKFNDSLFEVYNIKSNNTLIKDDSILKRVLDETIDTEYLLLQTWNDLGEGTQINRNYDYFDYKNKKWLSPFHFMNIIKQYTH